MRFISKRYIGTIILGLILILSSCGNDTDVVETNNNNLNNEDKTESSEKLEPVTLKMVPWDDEFMETLNEVLDETYPHITVEYEGVPLLHRNREGLEESVLANEIPDIDRFSVSSQDLQDRYEMDLIFELDDLIEKHNFDLTRIHQDTLDALRNFSNDGQLVGLPALRGESYPYQGAMSYNKDIFDLFGVDYPTHGMTWEEIISLAASVTGERGGTHYYGFQFSHYGQMGEWLGLKQPILDPETHEPTLLENEIWRRAFEILEEIYEIPGQLDPDNPEDWARGDRFSSERNIAMTPNFMASELSEWAEEEENPSWGVVAGPNYGDDLLPPFSLAWTYAISSTTEHPDDAFRVIEVLFSEEMQIATGEMRRDPTIVMLEESRQLVEKMDLPAGLEDLDLDAFNFYGAGEIQKESKYENEAKNHLYNVVLPGYVLSDQDIVTYLRNAEQELSSLVKELQGSE